jgi:hypothetical protein
MSDQQRERRPRSVPPAFGELLASCAAADAVSQPPRAPSCPERREVAVAEPAPGREERDAA